MDVTGITAARAQEIADSSIVSAYVNGSKQLVIVNGAGAESVAGQIDDVPWIDYDPHWLGKEGATVEGAPTIVFCQYRIISGTCHVRMRFRDWISAGFWHMIGLPLPLHAEYHSSVAQSQPRPIDGRVTFIETVSGDVHNGFPMVYYTQWADDDFPHWYMEGRGADGANLPITTGTSVEAFFYASYEPA